MKARNGFWAVWWEGSTSGETSEKVLRKDDLGHTAFGRFALAHVLPQGSLWTRKTDLYWIRG